MKTIRKILLGTILLIAAVYPSTSKAQVSLNSYFNVDWQFNIPLGNNFSNGASGWGMNFEGGYYITQDVSLGAFLNFHTNNEYFPRRTISLSETLSMSSRQQHQMFTLPFGLAMRYRIMESDFQPYVGMKLGMCYSEFNNYFIYLFLMSKSIYIHHKRTQMGLQVDRGYTRGSNLGT